MKPFLTCSPLPHPLHRNAIRPLHQQPHRRWIWAIYAALKPSKIVRERQLPDLGVEGFDVDRRRTPLGLFRPEHPGSPFEERRLPGRDLVRMDVELLRQLGQRLLALDGGQSHLCFESRAVIPARSSRHRLSCSRAILAALRQKLHSSACPNLLNQLCSTWSKIVIHSERSPRSHDQRPVRASAAGATPSTGHAAPGTPCTRRGGPAATPRPGTGARPASTLVHGSVRLASEAGWRSGAAPPTIPGLLPCRSRPMPPTATASRGSGTGSPTGPSTTPPCCSGGA